jgi:putative ABC transport system substrate-binding protein
MNRRALVTLAAATLAAPRFVFAQAASRVYRVAILDDAVESARTDLWRIFRGKLGALGLVEGRDVAYDVRYASGIVERLPALAAELVTLKPDVIAVVSTPATRAAIQATTSIPIVFLAIGDPVGSGLVKSLAHPAGNATGTSITTPEFAGKWLELLREIAPGAKKLGFLIGAENSASTLTIREFEKLTARNGMTIRLLKGGRRADLDRAFASIRSDLIQGLIVTTGALLLEFRDPIVQFAARLKLPVVYGRREYVDAGGLISYGADIRFSYMRGADQVHRILMGAKPGDLPVEQSSSMKMVLNMKTARAQGIRIPDSVRLRADEVIE